jgi:ABC-2 type transport system ATP-binding protein
MPEDFVAALAVSKSFGDNIAVDVMSFTVKKGEVFGLLGPNGAGKTTLMRVMSTVIPPDSGDIRVGGSSVRSDPAKVRAMLGVCPQALAIYEELTGLENLIFFARMSGLSAATATQNAA